MKKPFLLICILFYVISLNAQNLDRTITKEPEIELLSKSQGITEIPYYEWSKYSNSWIVKKNGGVHDNTNFDKLTISKYRAGNKIYYGFIYNSSDPYTLDIGTQLLQIENGTYKGEGAISNVHHSFYITQKQYDEFINFIENGNNGDTFTLKSRLTDLWLGELLYGGGVKHAKKMKFLRYHDKIRFRLPLGKEEVLFGIVSLKKEYFEVDLDCIINQLLIP